MEEFLHTLVTWLCAQGILPREATVTDRADDRNDKTYLMNLPEDVTDCYCVRQYNQRLHSIVAKDASVRYIQIIARNQNHSKALENIEAVYKFLINRPEPIEDISEDTWVIIDCQKGPVKLNEDSQGNYLYSLSFPITTKS